MILDVHCPDCGPFRHDDDLDVLEAMPNAKVPCPECGNEQAIVLAHDERIDERFRSEREAVTHAEAVTTAE